MQWNFDYSRFKYDQLIQDLVNDNFSATMRRSSGDYADYKNI